MRFLYGLRYTYYCADRRWRRIGVRGAPSTDYLIFAIVLLWLADFGFSLVCLNGGPGSSLPRGATKFVFECVGAGIALTISIWWSFMRKRVVDAMYREFEPDGVPRPINFGLIIRTVLVPIVIFEFLFVILIIWQRAKHLH